MSLSIPNILTVFTLEIMALTRDCVLDVFRNKSYNCNRSQLMLLRIGDKSPVTLLNFTPSFTHFDSWTSSTAGILEMSKVTKRPLSFCGERFIFPTAVRKPRLDKEAALRIIEVKKF